MYYIGYLLAGGTGTGIGVCIFWCFGWLFCIWHLGWTGFWVLFWCWLLILWYHQWDTSTMFPHLFCLRVTVMDGAFKADSHTVERVTKPALI
jgi:hypothetical protein